MLFKNNTLRLDLTAKHLDNLVQGEIRYIRNPADTIFCLTKGNFFVQGLSVINNATGLPLVIHQDFTPAQLYISATAEAGKPVYAAIRIINPNVTEVMIDYQAIGGKYQGMLGVILEMKDQLDGSFVADIPWNTIIGLPDRFKPAPHAHSFWDIFNLRGLLNSIYGVLVAINIKQREKYVDVYETMTSTLTAKFIDVGNKLTDLTNRLEVYRNAIQYDVGDIIVTSRTNNPANYLYYGTWALLPNVLLIGAAFSEELGELVGIEGIDPGDWYAKRVMFWQRQDDKASVRYTVTVDKTSINEGESATFTVTAPGRIQGTAVNYVITGVQENDIDKPLTGTLFLNSGGSASLTVRALADQLNEGVEYMRLTVKGHITSYAEVRINDTSSRETFNCFFTEDAAGEKIITDASEGDTVYFNVNVANGASVMNLVLLYDGSNSSNADFITTRPTTIRILDGVGRAEYKIKRDQRSEGNEYLSIFISTTSSIEQAYASARLRIHDTSLTPTIQSLITADLAGTLPTNNVNEGASFYLHIYTTDLENGTLLNLSYAGTYNSTDFTSTLPTTVTLTNNYARVKYTVKADAISESSEYIQIFGFLSGKKVIDQTVTLNDTSVNPGFKAFFSSNRFGTNELSWVNEGDTIYLIVQAGGVPDGTSLPLRYRGQAIAGDFSSVLPSDIIITNEVGYIPYTIANDFRSEGAETFIVYVMDPSASTDYCSANVTINDTSVEPTYDMIFSSDQFGNNVVTSVNEGQRVYVTVTATGISSITTLGLDIFIGGKRATVANGDVSETPPAGIVIIGGRGTFSILTREDSNTEGDEVLKIQVRASQALTAPVVIEKEITVRDTSKDPTWSIKLTTDEAGLNELVGDLLEGQTFYLQWTSENIPNGTVFWLGYGDGLPDNVVDEDFVDPLAAFFTVNNNRATVRYRVKQDYLQDQIDSSPERFIINVYSNVSMTTKILTKTTRILDPIFQMKFSGNSVGNGSIAQCNEGDIIYLVINTSNVIDNTEFKLEYYVNGVYTTVSGVDLIDAPAPTVTISNNKRILSIGIRADGIPDGQKSLEIRLLGLNASSGSTPLAVASVNMIDTSVGGATLSGSYKPGQIGTFAIAAGVSKTITLIGGGGSGALGQLSDPDLPQYDGYGGQSTSIRFGATTLAFASGGEGGLRSRGGVAAGGTTYINQNFIDNASQFTCSNIQVFSGVSAPANLTDGAASVGGFNSGAGTSGSSAGLGGGGGAVVIMQIKNNTTALLSFGVTVGNGGVILAGGAGFDWNNGLLTVS